MSATQAVLGFVHGSQCHLYYSVNSRAAWCLAVLGPRRADAFPIPWSGFDSSLGSYSSSSNFAF